jgi:hypothetical protein
MATADPQPGSELQQMAAPRPTTYHEASSAYRCTGDAQKRHDELTQRAALARARASLRARGELDPARHGTEEYEPRNVEEHLEVLATGELVARAYRHPANVDRALAAGATWEQVAAALDCDEAQAPSTTANGPRASTGCGRGSTAVAASSA